MLQFGPFLDTCEGGGWVDGNGKSISEEWESIGSALDAGVGLYSGLIHINTITGTITIFILVSGAVILIP